MQRWLEGVLRRGAPRLTFANNSPAPQGWGFKGRRIAEHHMVLIPSGRGRYWVEEEEILLEPGRLLLIGPGIGHSAELDPDEPLHLLTCRFLALGRAGWFTARLTQIRRLREHFERLHRLRLAGLEGGRQTRADALLLTLLGEAAEALAAREHPEDRRIAAVAEHLWRHPEERLNIPELARRARLSPKYFAELFTAQLGISPKRYQIQVRCEHARALLAETDQSIKEIAYALGYSSAQAFSAQFKAQAGVSPKTMQKNCRGEGVTAKAGMPSVAVEPRPQKKA